MSASREQSGFPKHYSIILFFVSLACLIAVMVAITTMVVLHITDPKADEKELMRDLHVRSVALDYAKSNTYDLFMAFRPRLNDSSALTSKSQLQRTYNLFYRQVSVYPADDHSVNYRQWTNGMDVPVIVRLEPDNRREILISDPEHLVWVRVVRSTEGRTLESRALKGHSITLAED